MEPTNPQWIENLVQGLSQGTPQGLLIVVVAYALRPILKDVTPVATWIGEWIKTRAGVRDAERAKERLFFESTLTGALAEQRAAIKELADAVTQLGEVVRASKGKETANAA